MSPIVKDHSRSRTSPEGLPTNTPRETSSIHRDSIPRTDAFAFGTTITVTETQDLRN